MEGNELVHLRAAPVPWGGAGSRGRAAPIPKKFARHGVNLGAVNDLFMPFDYTVSGCFDRERHCVPYEVGLLPVRALHVLQPRAQPLS